MRNGCWLSWPTFSRLSDTQKQHRRDLLSSLLFQLAPGLTPAHISLSFLFGHDEELSSLQTTHSLHCSDNNAYVPGASLQHTIIIDALDDPYISGTPTASCKGRQFLEDLVGFTPSKCSCMPFESPETTSAPSRTLDTFLFPFMKRSDKWHISWDRQIIRTSDRNSEDGLPKSALVSR